MYFFPASHNFGRVVYPLLPLVVNLLSRLSSVTVFLSFDVRVAMLQELLFTRPHGHPRASYLWLPSCRSRASWMPCFPSADGLRRFTSPCQLDPCPPFQSRCIASGMPPYWSVLAPTRGSVIWPAHARGGNIVCPPDDVRRSVVRGGFKVPALFDHSVLLLHIDSIYQSTHTLRYWIQICYTLLFLSILRLLFSWLTLLVFFGWNDISPCVLNGV